MVLVPKCIFWEVGLGAHNLCLPRVPYVHYSGPVFSISLLSHEGTEEILWCGVDCQSLSSLAFFKKVLCKVIALHPLRLVSLI